MTRHTYDNISTPDEAVISDSIYNTIHLKVWNRPALPSAANMSPLMEININKAQLPRLLPKFLFKLHLTKVSFGVCLIIIAIIKMALFNMLANIGLLMAGITSLFAGASGALANRLRSFVLHGGSVLVYAFSFYMCIIAYLIVNGLIVYDVDGTGKIVLFMINMMLLIGDMIISTLNIGVELLTIYVADCQRRLTIESLRGGSNLA